MNNAAKIVWSAPIGVGSREVGSAVGKKKNGPLERKRMTKMPGVGAGSSNLVIADADA